MSFSPLWSCCDHTARISYTLTLSNSIKFRIFWTKHILSFLKADVICCQANPESCHSMHVVMHKLPSSNMRHKGKRVHYYIQTMQEMDHICRDDLTQWSRMSWCPRIQKPSSCQGHVQGGPHVAWLKCGITMCVESNVDITQIPTPISTVPSPVIQNAESKSPHQTTVPN